MGVTIGSAESAGQGSIIQSAGKLQIGTRDKRLESERKTCHRGGGLVRCDGRISRDDRFGRICRTGASAEEGAICEWETETDDWRAREKPAVEVAGAKVSSAQQWPAH